MTILGWPTGSLVCLVVIWLMAAPISQGQGQDTATMMVLKGEVALTRPDGSTAQPAPSGSAVAAGDAITTLGQAGALLSFFVGTEIEVGEQTVMVVERVVRQGERIDVSLTQVGGASLHRVASFTAPGSLYRVAASGAVVEVRGTTFGMFGPVPTGAGNVVVLVCQNDCDGRSTLNGRPLAANTGFFVEVTSDRALGPVQTFAVDPAIDYWQNLWLGVTAFQESKRPASAAPPAGVDEQRGDARDDDNRNDNAPNDNDNKNRDNQSEDNESDNESDTRRNDDRNTNEAPCSPLRPCRGP